MKAVIMAGGEGTRLRPLTCTLPKPMARLCSKPVLEYTLDLLLEAGFKQATLTLGYMPNSVLNCFPDEEYKGMKLDFIIEDTPLGTAGGVKNALGEADEAVLVISGDAMCDFSLTDIIAFHTERGADATIVCTRVDDPREYGLVHLDDEHRVCGFLEKPSWGQISTDLANTGIYVLEPECLELIPDGVPYDFAGELFPKLLERGDKLCGCVQEGYWCDIGDLSSYRKCQSDMLSEKVRWKCSSPAKGIYAGGILPKGDFVIVPPVYIGSQVQIENGAVIGPHTVIDNGCLIGAGSKIRESVILENSYVSSACVITGAVVCSGVSIKKGVSLFEGSALGAHALVGEDSAVAAGVLIWPKREIKSGVVVKENLKFGSYTKYALTDDGIEGDFGVELTPEKAASLGGAVGSLAEKARVGVGTDGTVNAEALKYAVLGGLISCGARVWDFGACFEAQMYFYTAFCGLQTGIYVTGEKEKTAVRLCSKGGLSLTRATQRELEDRLSRGRFNRISGDERKSVTDMQSVNMMYMRELCNQAKTQIVNTEISYICSNRAINDVMLFALGRLGCALGSENLVVRLNESGTRATFFEHGMGYSFERLVAIIAYTELKNGSDVALPWEAPQIITHLGDTLGRRVLRYTDNSAQGSDTEAREIGVRQLWTRDALFLTVRILSLMREKESSLKKLSSELPEFYVARKEMNIDVSPARLTQKMKNESFSDCDGGGVFIKNDRGHAKVKASGNGTVLRIITESVSFEAARELCSEVEEIISRLALDIDEKK